MRLGMGFRVRQTTFLECGKGKTATPCSLPVQAPKRLPPTLLYCTILKGKLPKVCFLPKAAGCPTPCFARQCRRGCHYTRTACAGAQARFTKVQAALDAAPEECISQRLSEPPPPMLMCHLTWLPLQAYCLYRSARFAEALAALEAVPEDRAVARLQLEAQLFYRMGRNAEAISAYSELFQKHKVCWAAACTSCLPQTVSKAHDVVLRWLHPP